MAKFHLSSILSSVRGSIGPFTFRNDNSGGTLYARPGTRSIISRQLQEHHIFLRQANTDWSNLTEAQKKSWAQLRLAEVSHPQSGQTRPSTAKAFYIGWRLKVLHAHGVPAFDLLPPSPVYLWQRINLTLFRPATGLSFYAYAPGGLPPWPRAAAWVSWPPDGRRAPGRSYIKFWPVPGHETARQCIRLDSHFFDVVGYPPELRPVASGSYPQLVYPLFRHYRVFSTGQIGTESPYAFPAVFGQYTFTIPPLAPVFT